MVEMYVLWWRRLGFQSQPPKKALPPNGEGGGERMPMHKVQLAPIRIWHFAKKIQLILILAIHYKAWFYLREKKLMYPHHYPFTKFSPNA